MYVKVEHFDGRGTHSIFDVSGEIVTGHHFATDVQPTAQEVLGFDHWEFSVSWLASDDPTGRYEQDGKPAGDCWDLRYAWWRNDDGIVNGVISAGRIFVLDASGKTIDRV